MKYSLESQQARDRALLNYKEQCREMAMHFVAINGIKGDYLEFGTFAGDGLIQMALTRNHVANKVASLAARTNPHGESISNRPGFAGYMADFTSMRFIGFDSFEGLSEPTEEYERPRFAKGDVACSREQYDCNLKQSGVGHLIETVPGWFVDTLNAGTKMRLGLTKACIVNIDADLYEPSRLALEWCLPLLQDGTVVILDDWLQFNGHPRRGQQKAWSEWTRLRCIEYSPFFMNGLAAFIIHQ